MAKISDIIPKEELDVFKKTKSRDEIIAIAKDRYKQSNPTVQSKPTVAQVLDNSVYTEDSLLGSSLRGVTTSGIRLMNLADGASEMIGLDLVPQKYTNVANEALDVFDKQKQQISREDISPQRLEELKQLDQESADAKGVWDNVKAGANAMVDTAMHPSEWTAQGVVEMITDPLNALSFGTGSLAGKFGRNLIEKGVIGGGAGAIEGASINSGSEYIIAKGQGKSDDEASKIAIQSAAGGAVAGGGFGTLGGITSKTSTNIKEDIPDLKNEDVDSILDNELLKSKSLTPEEAQKQFTQQATRSVDPKYKIETIDATPTPPNFQMVYENLPVVFNESDIKNIDTRLQRKVDDAFKVEQAGEQPISNPNFIIVSQNLPAKLNELVDVEILDPEAAKAIEYKNKMILLGNDDVIFSNFEGWNESVSQSIVDAINAKKINDIAIAEQKSIDASEQAKSITTSLIEQGANAGTIKDEINKQIIPTKEELELTATLNNGMPVENRFAGNRLRQMVANTIEAGITDVDSIAIKLKQGGISDEYSKVAIHSILNKDINSLDNYISEKLSNKTEQETSELKKVIKGDLENGYIKDKTTNRQDSATTTTNTNGTADTSARANQPATKAKGDDANTRRGIVNSGDVNGVSNKSTRMEQRPTNPINERVISEFDTNEVVQTQRAKDPQQLSEEIIITIDDLDKWFKDNPVIKNDDPEIAYSKAVDEYQSVLNNGEVSKKKVISNAIKKEFGKDKAKIYKDISKIGIQKAVERFSDNDRMTYHKINEWLGKNKDKFVENSYAARLQKAKAKVDKIAKKLGRDKLPELPPVEVKKTKQQTNNKQTTIKNKKFDWVNSKDMEKLTQYFNTLDPKSKDAVELRNHMSYVQRHGMTPKEKVKLIEQQDIDNGWKAHRDDQMKKLKEEETKKQKAKDDLEQSILNSPLIDSEAIEKKSALQKTNLINRIKSHGILDLDISEKYVGNGMHKWNRVKYNRMDAEKQKAYEDKLKNEEIYNIKYIKDGAEYVREIPKSVYDVIDLTNNKNKIIPNKHNNIGLRDLTPKQKLERKEYQEIYNEIDIKIKQYDWELKDDHLVRDGKDPIKLDDVELEIAKEVMKPIQELRDHANRWTKYKILKDLDKDISYEEAYQAHQGTSFSPEKRARTELGSWIEEITSTYESLIKFATTPEKLDDLNHEFARYRSGLLKHKKELLSSRSRIVSSMISGGSNFPVARMKKLNGYVDSKMEKYINYSDKGFSSIKRKLTDSNIIKSNDTDAVSKLEAKLSQLESNQQLMKDANRIMRSKKTAEDKIKMMIDAGWSDKNAKAVISSGDKFESYQLTNNNAKIKNTKARIKKLKEQDAMAKSGGTDDIKYVGANIHENFDDKRVQIFFDDIPTEAIRSDLKSNGFKWSPKNKAWQRSLNNQSMYKAKNVLDQHFTKEDPKTSTHMDDATVSKYVGDDRTPSQKFDDVMTKEKEC